MHRSNPEINRITESAGHAATDHVRHAVEQERYHWFAELASALLVEISPQGEVLYLSPNVTKILGFAVEEILGGSVFARIHPEDLRHVQDQFAHRAGHVVCRHRHQDGSWRWLDAVRRDFVGSDGIAKSIAVVHDITRRKEAEEECNRLRIELARLAKLANLGSLAGGVAHDFNNLLTAIMAYAGLGRAEALKPDVIDALDQILKASERARQLTRQILAFSRHKLHSPQPVELAGVVEEAVALLRPVISSAVELRVDLIRNAGVVLADACQIHQIVLNLCSNAIHAMAPQGGRLTIELRPAAATTTEGKTGGSHDSSAVCLSVIDTGRGMDAMTRQRIFEPFFTTKPSGEGTGLGLANVEQIVREHHGSIRVSSAPGEGTRFDILFPVHRPPTA